MVVTIIWGYYNYVLLFSKSMKWTYSYNMFQCVHVSVYVCVCVCESKWSVWSSVLLPFCSLKVIKIMKNSNFSFVMEFHYRGFFFVIVILAVVALVVVVAGVGVSLLTCIPFLHIISANQCTCICRLSTIDTLTVAYTNFWLDMDTVFMLIDNTTDDNSK